MTQPRNRLPRIENERIINETIRRVHLLGDKLVSVTLSTAPAPDDDSGLGTGSTTPADILVRWTLVGNGDADQIIAKDYCDLTMDFRGQLLSWVLSVTPSATASFDLWHTTGATPTAFNALGLDAQIKVAAAASNAGTLTTPIDFNLGDEFRLDVVTNDVAQKAILEFHAIQLAT